MTIFLTDHTEEPEAPREAWDCNPDAVIAADTDLLDEEDDTGDWQTIALDRFGDRLVNGNW